MKNRIICLLLAVIMCVACLASCMGGGGGSTTDDNKDNTTDTDDKNDNTNTDDPKDDPTDDPTDDPDDPNPDNPNPDNPDPEEPPEEPPVEEDPWWDDITYSKTDILFQMTNCTNNQELPSGCERYLAGESKDNVQIDEMVRQRNQNAYKYTKVNVTYDYYPDNFTDYGYSNARNKIINTIDNSGDKCPDIFCNWMTDMLLVSLKGKFANLSTEQTKYGHNYFDIRVTEDAAENQYGYMTELMRSLTLNMGQIYVIASDYFIDLIRAFFVVPVNVNLFNQVATKVDPTLEDHDKNGVKDINDFFYEIEAGKWTYDRLMQYSKAIYERAAGASSESCNDTLGFALGKNGLPAAGMIYTNDIKVINRQWDDTQKKYSYAYPDNPGDLATIISKVSTMMDVDGIMCMDSSDAKLLGLDGDEATALLGIRQKFTTDKLLFGGVILVGSLEFDAYQNMKKNGGFGVVPVPKYTEKDADGKNIDYLTQIHVVGRAGGITVSTTKFSQCSAFIQYQTQHSTDVLNHYYKYNLTYGTASGVSGNMRMLSYIRNHVRTSFDKLFEDAIGFFFDNGISENDRYHTMLADSKYKFDNFTDKYGEYLQLKKDNLRKLEEEYAKLPK